MTDIKTGFLDLNHSQCESDTESKRRRRIGSKRNAAQESRPPLIVPLLSNTVPAPCSASTVQTAKLTFSRSSKAQWPFPLRPKRLKFYPSELSYTPSTSTTVPRNRPGLACSASTVQTATSVSRVPEREPLPAPSCGHGVASASLLYRTRGQGSVFALALGTVCPSIRTPSRTPVWKASRSCRGGRRRGGRTQGRGLHSGGKECSCG